MYSHVDEVGVAVCTYRFKHMSNSLPAIVHEMFVLLICV